MPGSAASVHRSLPPAPVADVVLVEPVVHGVAGSAWSARQVSTGRHLVVKLFPGLGNRAAELSAEFPPLAAVRHSGLVPIWRHGLTAAGIPFLIVEHEPTPTLAEWLAQHGAMPPVVAFGLVQHLAEAVATAQEAGYAHRALCPEAVSLIPSSDPQQPWWPRLLDIGLAELVPVRRSGIQAPEESRGGGDARVDVFALGVLLHRCLAGRSPVLGQPLRMPGTPLGTVGLVADCLAADPDHRPTLAQVSDRCTALQRRSVRQPRSARWAPVVAVVALVAAAVVVGRALVQGFTPPDITVVSAVGETAAPPTAPAQAAARGVQPSTRTRATARPSSSSRARLQRADVASGPEPLFVEAGPWKASGTTLRGNGSLDSAIDETGTASLHVSAADRGRIAISLQIGDRPLAELVLTTIGSHRQAILLAWDDDGPALAPPPILLNDDAWPITIDCRDAQVTATIAGRSLGEVPVAGNADSLRFTCEGEVVISNATWTGRR